MSMAKSPLMWQKSTFSGGEGQCVEIASADGLIHVRESDNPGTVVSAAPAKLGALVKGIKAGEFDRDRQA